ncbi:MAG: periplasmic heavy metal sensor [Pyrinomonadaceae bacterium]
MKKITKTNLILAGLMILASLTLAFGQIEPENDFVEGPPPADQAVRRGDLIRQLGLTQDQVRQLRQLNARRRPLTQEAQRRLRIANFNLDQAIYADGLDEATIQQRLREFQEAQAEVAKIKANNELEVRKILTPEQLVKFRELRQRFGNPLQRRANRNQTPDAGPPQDQPPRNQMRRQNRRQKP